MRKENPRHHPHHAKPPAMPARRNEDKDKASNKESMYWIYFAVFLAISLILVFLVR